MLIRASDKLLRTLLCHWALIGQLARCEIVGRYRGSVLGLFWSFVIPLMMILVYTFVFSFIFQARWGSETSSRTDFAIFLFSGLTIYSLFSECIAKAPTLIVSNPNYVKKFIFPLEILPIVSLAASIFHFAVSCSVLLVFYFASHGFVHWTVIFLPFILLPLLIFIVGLSWVLCSLGIYLRDVGQSIGIVMTLMLFISPIFYPASVLPAEFRPFLFLNPITFIIEQYRDILIFGNQPAWTRLGMYSAVSLTVLVLGFVWFQKAKKGFADVL